jgi:hypothetical protein
VDSTSSESHPPSPHLLSFTKEAIKHKRARDYVKLIAHDFGKLKALNIFLCTYLFLYNSSSSHHRQMSCSSGIRKENINNNSGIKHERDGKWEILCMCKFSTIPFHTRFHHCRFHDEYVLDFYQFYFCS